MSSAGDEEILIYAAANNLVVVSLDADFHALLAASAALKPSVVRIRIEGLKGDALASLQQQVVTAARSDLLNGAAVSVTQFSVRIRRLPLVT